MANNNKIVDLDKIARLAEALDSRMDNKISAEESRAKEVEADLQQSINDTQTMLGGKSIVYITQAEYDLLSEEEKNDDTKIYFVVDAADSTHNHENKDFLDSLNEENYLQMGADITSLKNNKLNASVYNDGIAEVKGLIEGEEERATRIEAQLQSAIDGKAPASHNHDDRYYTETEINGKIEDINEAIEGKAPSVHTHTVLSMKADNFKTVNDAPSTYERGETLFFVNAPTDRFNNLQYGLVQTLKEYGSGNAAWQFLYPYNDKTDTFYVRNGQYGEEGWRSWAEVYTSLNKPTAEDVGAAPAIHSHDSLYYTEAEIDGKLGTINTALNEKSNTDHTHDDRYYTETEINNKVNALNEADANLQASITSEVGKVDAKLGGKSFVYLTQADYDILTDEQKGDTSKIYVITDATDPTHTHSNKAYLDTLAAPTVVQVNPSGTILTLTTDKYQKTTIVDGTQIVFPTVDNFTEIHLYFDAETAMSLTFPDCRWRVDPNIEAGKSYEIVATYNTIRWLVNVIAYSSDDDMDPIIWYDNKEIYSDTGTMETADGYISSNFILLEENKDYQITVLNNTDTEIHCYDAEKNYLSDLDVDLTDYDFRVYSLRKMLEMDDLDISNTKYIRIESTKNDYINATNANENIIIEEIDTLEDNQVPLIILDGCKIGSTGNRGVSDSYISTQYIVLDNYFNYQFEFLGSDSTVNFYDEDENFISRDKGENDDFFEERQAVLNSDDFPEGTKFVRLRFMKNDTITFENIHEHLKVTKTPVVSENVVSLNWIENTNLDATNGEPNSSNSRTITDFIEIDDSYYYTITLDEPNDVKEYYYNSNKEFISRASYDDISIGNEVLEFPEGTKYVRLKSDIDNEYTIDVVREKIILRKFLKEENFLYSFGLLSDVHIDNNHDGDYEDKAMSDEDYRNALRFLEDEGANFIAYCGDMTKNYSSAEADYQLLAECLKESHVPNYIIKGNHDAGIGYFDTYVSEISRFTVPYKDDLFIFVGNGSTTGTNGGLTQSRIDYIRSIIEDNPNRRLFLMYHQFIRGYGSGDGTGGTYPYNTIGDDPDNALTNEFIELVTSTPNLIFCHGHSHIRFNLQDTCPTANYYHVDGECHDIHVPSCAKPRYVDSGGGLSSYYAGSEGYKVDVYSDKVIFKAIDFATNRYMPEYNQVVNLAAVAAEYDSIPNPTLYIDAQDVASKNGLIYDISGNNYPITNYNTSSLDDGTIVFNASNNSYLDCGLDPNDTCWTAEVYFRFTDIIEQDMTIFCWGETGNGFTTKYDWDQHTLDFKYGGDTEKDNFKDYIDYDTNTDLTNKFVHIVYSYDGESIVINVNGKTVIVCDETPMTEIAKNIIIGKHYNSDEGYANMELKLFRFYNGVALNRYQMQCNYLDLIGR